MTTKSNGRPINVVRDVNGTSKKSKATPRHAPDSVSLPPDKIQRCVATIQLALKRSNREEAIAAIERAFRVEMKSSLTTNSHLEELQLRENLVEALNAHNIFTIGDLLLCETRALYLFKGLRTGDISFIITTVESHGFRFSDAEDDE